MQTKAEEEEAVRKARAEADGVPAAQGDVEKQDGKSHDVARAEREEEEAVALSAVGPIPQAAVEADPESRAALDAKDKDRAAV
jgi:hypothetical protein